MDAPTLKTAADPAAPLYVSLEHPRVREVDVAIFTATFAPDCMTHACRCEDEGGKQLDDACCQHGCDVDLFERDAILARAADVAAVLAPAHRDPSRWFDESQREADVDAPSGWVVRTATVRPGDSGGCVFLEHDARGCALHRAALAADFAPESIKPAVCRMYPLTFGDGALCFSDDYDRYSCLGETGGPTVYRLMRPVLAQVFGDDVLEPLDRLEQKVLRRRLPLAPRAVPLVG